MLQDRLVCGVNHEGIQRKLLSEDDLSCTDALAIAQSIEAAESDAKILVNPTPLSGPVFHVPATNRPPKKSTSVSTRSSFNTRMSHKPTFYRCGGSHYTNVCRYCDIQCIYCKIKVHLVRMSQTKASTENRKIRPYATPTSNKNPPKTNHYMEQFQDGVTNSSDSEYTMNTVGATYALPFVTDVHVNDIPVNMEVHTVSAVSTISDRPFNK